jgi:hypothetical protein
MTRTTSSRALLALLLGLLLLVGAVACSDDDSTEEGGESTSEDSTPSPDDGDQAAVDGGELVGTFAVEPAACDDATGEVTGSYFRMVEAGGTVADGPFVPNADSACADTTFSGLEPGSDGGLVTADYQPQPDPPFDATNSSTADLITQPSLFFASGFGISTNPVDPESGEDVPVPTISVDAAGNLFGEISGWNVAWNGQQFNQGAPKADGSLPGNTTELTGTYDEATGEYELTWASQVVGGAFDGFTGLWHLAGTFEEQ